MIWDKMSLFYDFFETIYNGKCFRGIATEITNHVRENDIVLECACGTGSWTVPMTKKCKELIAADYAVGMLEQTKKKVKNYSNTKVEQASIWELPYSEHQFDVVAAANVIHLPGDPSKALNEMKRICKIGGRIIIPTYISDTKKNAKVVVKLLLIIGADYKKQFNLDSYKVFFGQYGIIDITYRIIDGHMPGAFAIFKNT